VIVYKLIVKWCNIIHVNFYVLYTISISKDVYIRPWYQYHTILYLSWSWDSCTSTKY